MMNNIFNVFGPSPIRPIEQHMHKAYTCAKQLDPLLDAVLAQDWKEAAVHHQKILHLEKEADVLKKNFVFIYPLVYFCLWRAVIYLSC